MATSKLQRRFGDMLDSNFPQYRIRENYRPDWLISSDNTWLELDFFIEDLKIAFEVQGDQHFSFTPFFHKTEEDFEKRKRHDREKRDLCYGRGVRLIEICTEMDALIVIRNLTEKQSEKRPRFKNTYIRLSQESHKRELENPKLLKKKAAKKAKIKKEKKPPQPKKAKIQPIELPGSHRMRNKARKLECEQRPGNIWRIWGGREEHFIFLSSNQQFICDCSSFVENGLCSHIIKVKMVIGDFPQMVTI